MTLDFGRTDIVESQDNLLGGSKQLVEQGITLISGQNLSRGAPLGRITASGKLTLMNPAGGDGSQTLFAILAEDVDASAGDEKGVAYVAGHFFYDGIQWDANIHQDDDRLDAILVGFGIGIYITKAGEDILEGTHTSTTTTTTTTTTA
jgi:hypothetical protein